MCLAKVAAWFPAGAVKADGSISFMPPGDRPGDPPAELTFGDFPGGFSVQPACHEEYISDALSVEGIDAAAVRPPSPRSMPRRAPTPPIKVVAGELDRIVTEAEAAIIASGAPVFVRAGELVRPVVDEVATGPGRTACVAHLRPLTTEAVMDTLASVATFERFDARTEKMARIDPPEKVVRLLLSRQDRWKFRKLRGLITTPTLRPDGTMLTAPGYDEATKLYLIDSGLQLPTVAARPTMKDAVASRDKLNELLDGFPFVDRVDRAVALSGILTAVLRGAISVAPLHAIRASTPGSGKSHFVDVCSAVATGRKCPVISAGKTEEETEKRLAALVREACPILSVDNVNGELGGDALCQISERPAVRLRILGRSEAPEIESRATLFATGNNLVLVGDMSRRTLLCNLDAEMERPETRELSFDPVERVLSNRGAFVAACITVARAYRLAGMPTVCGPLGSYGEWSAMVRAPLVWLGEADPVDSMERVRAEDPEIAAVRELFAHLQANVSMGANHTAKGLADMASVQNLDGTYREAEFFDFMQRVAGEGRAISTKRLGRWLTKVSGRIVDGMKLHVTPSASHGNRFSLRNVSPPR